MTATPRHIHSFTVDASCDCGMLLSVLVQSQANTLDQARAALEAAYHHSCHRSETRQKWTRADQTIHEQLKAVLAKLKGNDTQE